MTFELDSSYKQVPERLADLKEKHPDASLQPARLDEPFQVLTLGDKTFVVYVAACYRSPDDPRPGVGCAWEPYPGRTPYTKDSELQNAETSAWGRAIVAALASESKAVASAEDVRNRRAEGEPDPALLADLADAAASAPTTEALREVWRRGASAGALNMHVPDPGGHGEVVLGEFIAQRKDELDRVEAADPQAEAAEVERIRAAALAEDATLQQVAKLNVEATTKGLRDEPCAARLGGDTTLGGLLDERAENLAAAPRRAS